MILCVILSSNHVNSFQACLPPCRVREISHANFCDCYPSLFSNLFFSYFRLVVPHQATTQRSSVCCFLRSAASCRTTAGSCRASTGRVRPSTATSRCGVREVSYQHFVPILSSNLSSSYLCHIRQAPNAHQYAAYYAQQAAGQAQAGYAQAQQQAGAGYVKYRISILSLFIL